MTGTNGNGRPDDQLTLREAFAVHYVTDDLAVTTLKQFGYALTRWERHTDNPPIGDVNRQTIATFRAALAADESIGGRCRNNYWRWCRSIFRTLAEPRFGNPHGLGIIPSVPYMRPFPVEQIVPTRVDLDDLSRMYVATCIAQLPRLAVGQPAEWWKCLLVVAFCTGLRRGDLMALRFDQFDHPAGTLNFTAQKTGKAAVAFPLHPCVSEHVRRLDHGGELLFAGNDYAGGNFGQRWHEMREHAGISQRFTLHDLRRTGACEVERVRAGMASVFLQHRQADVTHTFYLNQAEELREAVLAMRVPLAFTHGPNLANRSLVRERKAIQLRPERFAAPRKPGASEWTFDVEGQFWFRGECYALSGTLWHLLKMLALSPDPVNVGQLTALMKPSQRQGRPGSRVKTRVHTFLSMLRTKLREFFALPANWNAVPCLARGQGGRWSLLVPPASDSHSSGSSSPKAPSPPERPTPTTPTDDSETDPDALAAAITQATAGDVTIGSPLPAGAGEAEGSLSATIIPDADTALADIPAGLNVRAVVVERLLAVAERARVLAGIVASVKVGA